MEINLYLTSFIILDNFFSLSKNFHIVNWLLIALSYKLSEFLPSVPWRKSRMVRERRSLGVLQEIMRKNFDPLSNLWKLSSIFFDCSKGPLKRYSMHRTVRWIDKFRSFRQSKVPAGNCRSSSQHCWQWTAVTVRKSLSAP